MKLQKLVEHKALNRISNSLDLKQIAMSVFSSVCLRFECVVQKGCHQPM